MGPNKRKFSGHNRCLMCAHLVMLNNAFATQRTGAHQAPLPKNTGMGCHFLPQGIFPTQGSNPGICCTGRQTLNH